MKKNNRNSSMIIKSIVYVILFLVSLIIYVGATIIVLGWDWTLLYDVGFWVRSILLSTANMTMGVTILSAVYDTLEFKDSEYLEIESAIKKESIQLIGHKLTADINKINWSNKKDSWIKIHDIELENHTRKIKPKVAFEIESSTEDDKLSRPAKRYLDKKKDLETKLTSEWIDKFLHYQKVVFAEITQAEVIYGLQKAVPKKSLLERNILRNAIFGKLFWGLLFSALAVLSAFIIPSGQVERINFLTLAVINLFILFINLAFSVFSGHNAHNKRLVNAVSRFEILKNHKSGFYNNFPEVPKKKFNEKQVLVDTKQPVDVQKQEQIIEEKQKSDQKEPEKLDLIVVT